MSDQFTSDSGDSMEDCFDHQHDTSPQHRNNNLMSSIRMPKNLEIPHMKGMPHVNMPHVPMPDLRATLLTGKKSVQRTSKSMGRVLKKATHVSYGAVTKATNASVGAVTTAANVSVGAVAKAGNVSYSAVSKAGNVSYSAVSKATNVSVGALNRAANVSVDSMTKASVITMGSVKTAATTVGSLLGEPIITVVGRRRRPSDTLGFETANDFTSAHHDLSDSTADSLMLWEGLEEATEEDQEDDEVSIQVSHAQAEEQGSSEINNDTHTSLDWNDSDLESCLLKLNERFPMDETFHDSYSMGKSLGQGSFGSVRRCTSNKDNSGTSYAVKSVPLAKYDPEEIEILRELQACPHVVQVEEVFIDHSRSTKADDAILIVMEEIAGGELLDRIAAKECYTEGEARELFQTLLETVQFCHSKGIAHCDIKPENIMLTSRDNDVDIKLVDFGLARRFLDKNDGTTIRLMEMHGSPEYAAPEVFNRDETTGGDGYDERCDIWSLGVVLYVLLGGYGPFEAPSDEPDDMIKAVATGKIKFHKKYWKDISREAKILIARMLTVDPNKRISLEEALASPWFFEDDEETETEVEEEEPLPRQTQTQRYSRSNRINNSKNAAGPGFSRSSTTDDVVSPRKKAQQDSPAFRRSATAEN